MKSRLLASIKIFGVVVPYSLVCTCLLALRSSTVVDDQCLAEHSFRRPRKRNRERTKSIRKPLRRQPANEISVEMRQNSGGVRNEEAENVDLMKPRASCVCSGLGFLSKSKRVKGAIGSVNRAWVIELAFGLFVAMINLCALVEAK